MMPLRPNHDLIVATWLGTLGLSADGIGTDLPADAATWAAHGFIQVATVGGSPVIDVPIRQPSVQIDVWANRVGSELPPWNKAGHLCEEVFSVFESFALYGHVGPVIVQPDGYQSVRLLSVWPDTEPRKIADDPANFARWTFDVSLRWVAHA